MCKTRCNRRAQCKAFSFNRFSKRCVISDRKLGYDADFSLYIRSSPLSQDGTPFKAVSGLKVISDESEKESGYVTLAMCQNDCVHNAECKSISYDFPKKACIVSGTSVQLGSSWDYYDKGEMLMHSPEERNYFSPRYMRMERQLQATRIKEAIEKFKSKVVKLRKVRPRVKDVPEFPDYER